MVNTRWTDQLIGKIGQIRLIYCTTIISGEMDGDYDVDDGHLFGQFGYLYFPPPILVFPYIEHSLGKQ